MNDKNETVRAIIERAMSDLIAVGLDRNGAAALLSVQGVIRLDCSEQLAGIAQLVSETAQGLAGNDSLH